MHGEVLTHEDGCADGLYKMGGLSDRQRKNFEEIGGERPATKIDARKQQ